MMPIECYRLVVFQIIPILQQCKLKVGNGEGFAPRNGRWNFNNKIRDGVPMIRSTKGFTTSHYGRAGSASKSFQTNTSPDVQAWFWTERNDNTLRYQSLQSQCCICGLNLFPAALFFEDGRPVNGKGIW